MLTPSQTTKVGRRATKPPAASWSVSDCVRKSISTRCTPSHRTAPGARPTIAALRRDSGARSTSYTGRAADLGREPVGAAVVARAEHQHLLDVAASAPSRCSSMKRWRHRRDAGQPARPERSARAHRGPADLQRRQQRAAASADRKTGAYWSSTMRCSGGAAQFECAPERRPLRGRARPVAGVQLAREQRHAQRQRRPCCSASHEVTSAGADRRPRSGRPSRAPARPSTAPRSATVVDVAPWQERLGDHQ